MVWSGRCSYTRLQSMALVFCMVRPLVICSQHRCIGPLVPVGTSTNGSDGQTDTSIARRCGGFSNAASHWMRARYEPPIVPTAPFDQGCAAHHSIESKPSRPSLRYGTNTPSE